MAFLREGRDVTVCNPTKVFDGYTLFATSRGKDEWLIDIQGRVVHHWEMKNPTATSATLLPSGNLLWQGRGPDAPEGFGGNGTELVEVDWDGNEVWRYDDMYLNHDFPRLENGNTIINRFVKVPDDLASKVKGGMPGADSERGMWSCSFQEITPDKKVVWEWKHYEHLDVEKDVICPFCDRTIWGYTNSIDVFPDGNILCTFRLLNTIAIIDKKSGDILWRWGPEHELGHQHCCTVLQNGNILLFDNGLHRQGTTPGITMSISRVLEVNPKTDKIEWEYKDPNAPMFFSSVNGSAQRLPNGNTFICESTRGRFFEVTRDKEMVWEYYSPFLVRRPPLWDWHISATVFAAKRYSPDYPGLKGKTLDPNRYERVVRKKDEQTLKEEEVLKRLESLGY